ncbi:glycosyltransferase family 2 protein [uncultured Clostridium sp.]|uniref:glycosyltransferase family 2 protein n=1 Tax=uncultured Clostridium sp. TaxID=59620 RepID=UPI00262CF1D4|nr:glycosyltransferase family 2 protein [uncultured Clostridium sp.]
MKVSIIVSTYRRKESLERALKSLIEQTYRNIEILVIDDNEDSKWNEEVKSTVLNLGDSRIKYIKNKKNLGSAETRNRGIYAADGVYITFLDDDDVYGKYKVENQVNKMIKEKAEYSVTDLELVSEKDIKIEIRTREYIKKTDKDNLLKYHLMYHITGTDSMMFKTDYLRKINGFDPIDIGDEFYLMKKAIEAGGKFIYIPICDIKAYVHTGEESLSSGESKIKGENILYKYKEKYFNRLTKKEIKYVKMRHFAVLAFAEIRRKKYMKFIKYSCMSMLNEPKECVKLIINR